MALAKINPNKPYNADGTGLGHDPVALTGVLPGSGDTGLTVAKSWSVGSLAAGANATTTLAAAGLNPGDFLQVAAAPAPPAGVVLLGTVSAAGTITVTAFNQAAATAAAFTTNLSVRGYAQAQALADHNLGR